ncbi:huntingtin-interacting protein K [Planococcus citri]|uniref:huntingtin-interacting protein K n=1 Tax=Planococcus citri TaxID=170843 RepID=UPI0031F7BFEA
MSAPQVNGVPESNEIDGNDASSKKKFNHAARDLEKVTDYAEEKEVISAEQFQGAMSIIDDRRNKEAAEKRAKENELLKVSIKKEDVDLIVKEMEITRSVAERTLRVHNGNVVNALIALTN